MLGVDLFSIGQTAAKDGSFQTIDEETDGRYTGFVFRENRLVGAILLGDTRLAARVKRAIEEREDFSGELQKHLTAARLADQLR